MYRLILLLVVGVVSVSGCNNRSRGSMTTDPLCPGSAVSTGELCDATQDGIMCSGTVRCACGERSTTCGCGMSAGGGYSFQCVDSCSCPTSDGGTGGSRCGTFFDRVQASPCPYPPGTLTRDEIIMQCNDLAALSEACRAALETFLSCALTAPIECSDGFPTIPSCPIPSDCT